LKKSCFKFINVVKTKINFLEKGETKIIQYDEHFPVTVVASNKLTRMNIIKNEQNRYIELTDPKYKEETFVVEKMYKEINVDEFLIVYENTSGEEVEVDTTITQNGMSFYMSN
jgi:hypothetical protein